MKGVVLDGRILRLDPTDTVGTAIVDLDKGETIRHETTRFEVSESIPFGHKIAFEAIDDGSPVRKYGEIIGQATTCIQTGEWVHTHNIESLRGRGDRESEIEP